MTIGQRISQKRKELSLSQEALGEKLGVTRQAIYKWEADIALPEIEKLIALSRIFGVSVGALLGAESEAAPAADIEAEADAAPQPVSDASASDDLTPHQLKMVEEIVARYLAAAPAPPKRRKLPFVLAALALIIIIVSLFTRLSRLDDRYSSLQNSVSGITHNVSNQISGISYRVEEILKAQNSLTAEYGAAVTDTFPARDTVRVSAWAVPKTYTDGMTAEFIAVSGGETFVFPADEQDAQRFAAEFECALSNSISVSAVFVLPDGTRQTQLLQNWTGYRSATLPTVQIEDHNLHFAEIPDRALTLDGMYFVTYADIAQESGASAIEIKLGVFRNMELVAWAVPCEKPENYLGYSDDAQFYRFDDVTLRDLTTEDTVQIAALVTDNYGRQFIACEVPYAVALNDEGDFAHLTYPSDGRISNDLADWVIE